MSQWKESVERTGIIAILRNGSELFIELHLERLVKAGLEVIEVSQTSATYHESLSRLLKCWGEHLQIGAGTILTIDDANRAVDLGATFLVSPHFNPALAEYVLNRRIPYVAGCLTPSEVVQALHAKVDAIKIFPASLGGPGYIKALRAPFPTGSFIPTGGVSLEDAPTYWKAGAWAVGIGSEISSATPENGWPAERLLSLFRRDYSHD